MTKEFHIEMIDNIEDYTKRFTIVRGMCDIVEKKLGVFSSPGSNYVITNNDYWTMLGNLSDDAIKEVFEGSYFGDDDGVTREGCYEYKASIYYESGTWNEPGELYCTKQSAELYIDYIDFVFVESFESRLREQKLNELLGKDLFPL
jgi:hypothetical protein